MTKRLKYDRANMVQQVQHEQEQHTAHERELKAQIKDLQVGFELTFRSG